MRGLCHECGGKIRLEVPLLLLFGSILLHGLSRKQNGRHTRSDNRQVGFFKVPHHRTVVQRVSLINILSIRYAVSSFSYALLEQIRFDPLFDIADLNTTLYKRARGLDRVRSYRLQLYYIKDFIISCRYATRQPDYYYCRPILIETCC